MSWGATSFTPIISYNEPPFGFHERPQEPDFPVCVENPYVASSKLKQRIKKLWNKIEKNNKKCTEEFTGTIGTLKNIISPYSGGELHYGVITVWLLIIWYFWTKYMV
jgi:hypothetical protein